MTITASITTAQAATYIGQTWYDLMGNMIEETGHAHPATAADRIAAIDKAIAGRWCFAVIKIKTRENGIDRWTTTVLFPDGKTRKLIQGEIPVSQRSKGNFITLAKAKEAAAAAKLPTVIRAAPDTRFPWHANAVEAKLERFLDMISFERWLMTNTRPKTVVFLFEPGKHVRAPDEEMLFAYLAVVAE